MQATSALLGSLLLVPFALPGDAPALVHKEGQTISRSWSLTTVRKVEEATLSLMGNDQDIGSGSVRSNQQTLEVSDQIAAVAEGRATRFRRSYDSLESERETEGIEETETLRLSAQEGASELEGQVVEFEQDAGAWARSYGADSSGEPEWLDELAVDMDLAALLPVDDEGGPVEVAVGDSWDVPFSFIGDLLSPGGTLQVHSKEDVDVPEGGISIQVPSTGDTARWDELEGDLVATYEELVAEEGQPRLARIVLEIDLSGEIDLVDELEQAASDRGAEESFTAATVERELTGRVEILWNLDASLPQSLEGALECAVTMDCEWTIAAGEMELEIASDSSGTVEYALEASWSL